MFIFLLYPLLALGHKKWLSFVSCLIGCGLHDFNSHACFILLFLFYFVFCFFKFLPSSTGELQRTECLRSLREIAIPLAERPARGDLTGEICHWADGYHLNVRLYEKLLLSVFDMLDEGKLTEVGVFYFPRPDYSMS